MQRNSIEIGKEILWFIYIVAPEYDCECKFFSCNSMQMSCSDVVQGRDMVCFLHLISFFTKLLIPNPKYFVWI